MRSKPHRGTRRLKITRRCKFKLRRARRKRAGKWLKKPWRGEPEGQSVKDKLFNGKRFMKVTLNLVNSGAVGRGETTASGGSKMRIWGETNLPLESGKEREKTDNRKSRQSIRDLNRSKESKGAMRWSTGGIKPRRVSKT